MRKAGRVVAEILEEVSKAAKPGITTKELDQIARDVLNKRGAKSNFLGYHGYPAVICTSPNNVVVHGIPSNYVLKEGDILSIDAGAIVEGYHGDAAVTIPIGEISTQAAQLIKTTQESLYLGIDALKAGAHLHEVGRVIQNYAESKGYSVVRQYVGHAIGTQMHEEPQVPNYWPGFPGPVIEVGNVFALEPMLNIGRCETKVLDDGWAVVTLDGSLSAHFEHTVAVTEEGPEILTVF
jgi:methionyl aminopeptidase